MFGSAQIRATFMVRSNDDKSTSRRGVMTYVRQILAMLMSGVICMASTADGWAAQFAVSPVASQTRKKDATVLQHFVFIVKENRSFDSYFGAFPGADGAKRGLLSTGQKIPLMPLPDVTITDPDHTEEGALTGMDSGKMDGFDLEFYGNINGEMMAYRQFPADGSGIPNYWTYAQNFVLADHMFTSMHGPSFPNHLYTVAATNGGVLEIPGDTTTVGADAFEDAASLEPQGGNPRWGCDSGANNLVRAIDAQGNISAVFPCFDFQTLADSLEKQNLSWKYYAPSKGERGYLFSTLDAIKHIRETNLWAEHVVPATQFVTDAQNGNLPAVSWVVSGLESEHPPNSTCVGENWTVQLINAVMQGPDWNSTAIFVTWDDAGGFYDHVVPPVVDGFGFGIRVPLLIVSPYAIPGHISKTRYEFSSVLKTIEERFNLPYLTERDTKANDTYDSFDFNQQALSPVVLSPRQCPPNSTNYLQFGSRGEGTASPPTEVEFTNYSSEPITFSSIQITGDFKQATGCKSQLKPGFTCRFSVTFDPTTTGTRKGTLTITDSDPSSPQKVALTGLGSSINFGLNYPGSKYGQVLFGDSKTKQTSVINVSNQPVTISSATIVGPGAKNFAITGGGCKTIQANSRCTWKLTYKPTPIDYGLWGNDIANFVISDSAPGSPHTLRILGFGTALGYSPSGLNFGNQKVGTQSQPKTVNLTNTGSTTLNVASFGIVGDYSQTNTCGGTIAAGAKCQIAVVFAPQVQGKDNGSLDLNTNDQASPRKVSLNGSGT
jgi:phospholipase C